MMSFLVLTRIPMTPTNAQLLSILRESREDIVKRSTDIVFASSDTPLERNDVEQMLRACTALLEEALVGESTDVRSGFLEALPDIARTSTWDNTLRAGMPCWGIILCQLVTHMGKEHQAEATQFLSRFMGAWWADVSKKMLPVFIAEDRL
jgi:hypothetical protein